MEGKYKPKSSIGDVGAESSENGVGPKAPG
jgi:hypothetical protein